MSVQAIRGAVTVNRNDRNSILKETEELLREIAGRNEITEDDIISIVFSVTDDINAVFPAEAARIIGWKNTPLMCTREINVPGSLKKCVRVLMHINTEKNKKEISHVYLKGAEVLRKDLEGKKEVETMDKKTIAVDGPAGAGKSTVARLVSDRLNLFYLDTGAMYRTVALKALSEGIESGDMELLSKLVSNIDIRVVFENGEQRMYLDGRDVTGEIRTKEVTKASSDVAIVPEVRMKMVEIQREMAKKHGIIMDGRDIGSYVLPDADYKFFLTAALEERAKRRYLEQIDKGIDGSIYEEVLEDIKYRDKNDSSRRFAPLIKAEDAIEIDTTDMSIKEVVNRIVGIVEGG